jgi:hypothetical protein
MTGLGVTSRTEKSTMPNSGMSLDSNCLSGCWFLKMRGLHERLVISCAAGQRIAGIDANGGFGS